VADNQLNNLNLIAGATRLRPLQKWCTMAEIAFKDFSAFYKYKKQYYIALDKINLNIRNGKITVVVGPSGCGKTTLLKCVAGLHDLTEGELLSDGENVESLLPNARNIAYVAQEYSLYPQMTVYDNIAYSLKLMKTPYAEIKERVTKIAKELEIEWLLTRKPKQLSGGQQQRTAIARALIKQPSLILFDEPFANLERPLRLQMQQLIKDIHAMQKQTIIFVTHDLTEAFFLADEIVVLDNGCVVQVDSPEEMEKHPKSDFVKEFLQK
jgi:multiple sugar transport system ATP-binding protein